MAAIFEEVHITWPDAEGNPVEWHVTPTYRTVQQIEQRVSIAGLSARIANGEPPISQMAHVLYVLLQSAGCTHVTEPDIFAEIMTTEDEEALGELARTILLAFVPSKKSGSPAPATKATRAKSSKGKSKT